jgi:hypothetical protein
VGVQGEGPPQRDQAEGHRQQPPLSLGEPPLEGIERQGQVDGHGGEHVPPAPHDHEAREGEAQPPHGPREPAQAQPPQVGEEHRPAQHHLGRLHPADAVPQPVAPQGRQQQVGRVPHVPPEHRGPHAVLERPARQAPGPQVVRQVDQPGVEGVHRVAADVGEQVELAERQVGPEQGRRQGHGQGQEGRPLGTPQTPPAHAVPLRRRRNSTPHTPHPATDSPAATPRRGTW